MAKLPQSFTEDTTEEFLPAGDYLAELISNEMKPTKSNDGEYLSLMFKVMEGPYKDASLYTNLNLINSNDVAVKIARGQLKKFIAACGKDPQKVVDADELLHIPITLVVSRRPDTDAYPGNEIKGYKKAGAAGVAKKANPFKK